MDLKSIIKLETELNKIQDVDLLLERILLEARKVVRADAGSIYVVQKEKRDGAIVSKLSVKYAQNDTIAKNLEPGQKLIYSVFSVEISDKTVSGYCAFTKKIVNVPDVYNISPDAPYSYNIGYDLMSGYKCTSTLAIPLQTPEGRLLGVIQIINAQDEKGNIVAFSHDGEMLIAHFATSATLALQKAYATRDMILRMIKMSELRDPKETGTHVNRVAGYAVEIYDRWAYHRNIPKEEREQFKDTLKIGAMLHDVGKVAISDVILKKPARFTPEEFAIMQHHTLYGAQLFEDASSPLDVVALEISLNHHENWDGTGYPGWVDPFTGTPVKVDDNGRPLGKKGEEIPLAGRIVAIADVYDALSSRRVYKDPWQENDVLEEIRKLSGTKFDPELVNVFFEILPIIRQIHSLYPELDIS
jgi:HD-GYP domain-containing protein (c-di-GMP phosphodiesterase class II)